ncbi:hypothetical protein FOZ60_012474 [Perkinsus olseni]|uniref:Uncharacterized protein n=1 Tax=Perkinsus olseni TaxID=32597 RepID=A0A7J6NCK8_PEROL|nr:hypothetical protein FOZ60_012474 [Perkinsus olseni]
MSEPMYELKMNEYYVCECCMYGYYVYEKYVYDFYVYEYFVVNIPTDKPVVLDVEAILEEDLSWFARGVVESREWLEKTVGQAESAWTTLSPKTSALKLIKFKSRGMSTRWTSMTTFWLKSFEKEEWITKYWDMYHEDGGSRSPPVLQMTL